MLSPEQVNILALESLDQAEVFAYESNSQHFLGHIHHIVSDKHHLRIKLFPLDWT